MTDSRREDVGAPYSPFLSPDRPRIPHPAPTGPGLLAPSLRAPFRFAPPGVEALHCGTPARRGLGPGQPRPARGVPPSPSLKRREQRRRRWGRVLPPSPPRLPPALPVLRYSSEAAAAVPTPCLSEGDDAPHLRVGPRVHSEKAVGGPLLLPGPSRPQPGPIGGRGCASFGKGAQTGRAERVSGLGAVGTSRSNTCADPVRGTRVMWTTSVPLSTSGRPFPFTDPLSSTLTHLLPRGIA